MKINEQNILTELRNGDLHIFEQLFNAYYTMLCNIANGYLNNKQQAEEVTCDVFQKIWENRTTIEIHTSVKAYLIRAVRNRSLNYLEQVRFEHYFLKGQTETGREDILLTDYDTPLSLLLADDLEIAINHAIESLPAECREIFRLSRFENLRYDEIAVRRNISVNTVKTQIKIALQKLRSVLAPYLSVIFCGFL